MYRKLLRRYLRYSRTAPGRTGSVVVVVVAGAEGQTLPVVPMMARKRVARQLPQELQG